MCCKIKNKSKQLLKYGNIRNENFDIFKKTKKSIFSYFYVINKNSS